MRPVPPVFRMWAISGRHCLPGFLPGTITVFYPAYRRYRCGAQCGRLAGKYPGKFALAGNGLGRRTGNRRVITDRMCNRNGLIYIRTRLEKLVESGHAYYCYCSQERLENLREEQIKNKLPPGYDRCCRDLTPEQRQEKEAAGIKPVVRFKTPLQGQTEFHDDNLGRCCF